MEWVETTGRTVEEALDAALDMLGVHEDDVEFEVLEEPKAGFLGRFGGSDARIRARVKPISREKPGDRRRRRTRGGGGGGGGSRPGRGDRRPSGESRRGEGAGEAKDENRKARPGPERPRREQPQPTRDRRAAEKTEDGGATMEDVTVEAADMADQAATATEFTQGLVEAIGLTAQVRATTEDDTVHVEIDGSGLGLLIGPRAATLGAIEELTRAVVQRATGGHAARVTVDVAGYRAKRRAALEDFARELAEQVESTGEEIALEPMSSPDRKVVHDTISEIDGVETSSEGEDPRRYVVIRRA
jgi:spoIIIJ-associated protein